MSPPVRGRQARRISFRAWLQPLLAIVLVRLAFLPIGLVGRAFFAAAALVMLRPWWVARLVTVPLGWVRASAFLGWLAEDVWRHDADGGRLLGAAWALLRGGSSRHLAALEALAQRPAALGAAGIVGAGFLAAARGDAERARALLRSVDLLPFGIVPAEAARLGLTWRLADALAGAEWAEAELLGRRLDGAARVAALAAARLGGRSAVTEAELRRAWQWNAWRAPALRPLVERALAVDEPAESIPPSSVSTADADPLDAALRRHVALVAAGAPTLADFQATAAAWDVLAGVADLADVEADLAALALAAGVALPESAGGVLLGAQRRLRRVLLDDVEAACRGLQLRAGAGRDLPPLLEWSEILAIREVHDRAAALGGLPVRRLVFPELHAAVCPLACRLWNDRRQHILAGAVFRWLFDEAVTVGDARLAEHERRNVGAAR